MQTSDASRLINYNGCNIKILLYKGSLGPIENPAKTCNTKKNTNPNQKVSIMQTSNAKKYQ